MTDAGKSRGRLGVLLALDDGPKHGYAIAKYLKEQTQGHFSLSFGALYPILHRLETEGIVYGDWHALGSTKRKKVYSLTGKGHERVSTERESYRNFVTAFSQLLGM